MYSVPVICQALLQALKMHHRKNYTQNNICAHGAVQVEGRRTEKVMILLNEIFKISNLIFITR